MMDRRFRVKLAVILAFGLAGPLWPAKSTHAGVLPLVEEVEGALGSDTLCGASCWTNHLRMTDLDGDDDLDLIFVNYADFFGGTDAPQPLVVFLNDGDGQFTHESASVVDDLETNAHQICVGDVDGDGARDIYVPDGIGSQHRLLINDGLGIFTDEGQARLPASVPRAGACRFGDLDGDGDLDLIIADGYGGRQASLLVYDNDGDGQFSERRDAFTGEIVGQDIDDIEVFDADRDFDLDIFANAHAGGHGGYFVNDGLGNFEVRPYPPPQPGGTGYHYNVASCDVDNDGDLDLWIDNIGGGFGEQLSINDGAGNFEDRSEAQVVGNPGVDDNGVVCVDLDNDGDSDAVVLSLATPERLLENEGTGSFRFIDGAFPPSTDSTLWGEFGDLNADGRLDLVTGQGEFGDQSNKVYLGTRAQPVDDRAPNIVAVEPRPRPLAPPFDDIHVLRFAVADRVTSDEGPRLARAFITLDPTGAAATIDAIFVGGDLFQVELPAPTTEGYEFQACAEDAAGNVGCSETVFVFDDPAGTGGMESGGGNTGESSGDDEETRDEAGTETGDKPGATTDTGSHQTMGATDDGAGGCACRAQRGSPSHRSDLWLWLSLGLPLAVARRRR